MKDQTALLEEVVGAPPLLPNFTSTDEDRLRARQDGGGGDGGGDDDDDDESALLATIVTSASSREVDTPSVRARKELARTNILDDMRLPFVVGMSLHGPKLYESYGNLVREVLAKSSGPARDLLFEMEEQGQPSATMTRPQSAPQRRSNEGSVNLEQEKKNHLEAVLDKHLIRASSVLDDDGNDDGGNKGTAAAGTYRGGTALRTATTLSMNSMSSTLVAPSAARSPAGTTTAFSTTRFATTATITRVGDDKAQTLVFGEGSTIASEGHDATLVCSLVDDDASGMGMGMDMGMGLGAVDKTSPRYSATTADERPSSPPPFSPEARPAGIRDLQARVTARMNEALADDDDEAADIGGQFAQMLRQRAAEKRRAALKRRRLIAGKFEQHRAFGGTAKVIVKAHAEEEKAVLVNVHHAGFGPYRIREVLEFQEFFKQFFPHHMVHLHHHNESNTLEDTRITREMILDSPYASALTQYTLPLKDCRFNLGEGIAVVQVSPGLRENLHEVCSYLRAYEAAERKRQEQGQAQAHIQGSQRTSRYAPGRSVVSNSGTVNVSLSQEDMWCPFDPDNRILSFLREKVGNGGGLVDCMRIGHRHRFCSPLEAAEILSLDIGPLKRFSDVSVEGRRRIASMLHDLYSQISHSMSLRLVSRLGLTKRYSVSLDQCLLVVFPFAKYEERQRMYAALKIDGFIARFAHFVNGDENTSDSASTTQASSSSSSSSATPSSQHSERKAASASSSSSSSSASSSSEASNSRRPSSSTIGTLNTLQRRGKTRGSPFTPNVRPASASASAPASRSPIATTRPIGRTIMRQRTGGLLGLTEGHLVFGKVSKEWSDDCVGLFKHLAEAFCGTVSLQAFLEILHTHGLCQNQHDAHRLAIRQGVRPPHKDLTGWDAVKVLHIVTSNSN